MTNPTHCAFTVQVEFRSTLYDVKITPTLDGKTIKWLDGKDRVVQWNKAEETHKLFSQKILEMLETNTAISEDYLQTRGDLKAGSVTGFTFNDDSEIKHTTQTVWEEFIRCLESPAAQAVVARVAAGVKSYSTLGAEGQKAARLELFQKKVYEHFAQVNGITLSHEISEYSLPAKACLAFHNPLNRKLPPGEEATSILVRKELSEEERDEMSRHVELIREWAEREAARLNKAAADSDSEELTLDSSEEKKAQVEDRLQSSPSPDDRPWLIQKGLRWLKYLIEKIDL